MSRCRLTVMMVMLICWLATAAAFPSDSRAATDGFNSATFDDPHLGERLEADDSVLSRSLLNQAGPAALPFLSRRLDNAADPLMKRELLGLLAACGSQAAPFLNAYYDRLAVTRIAPLSGPFALPECPPQNSNYGYTRLSAGNWPQVVLNNGTRVVAFTSSGLFSSRDIYLALDADRDGRYERVLPTGLADVYGYDSLPGGFVDCTGGAGAAALQLSLTGKALTIGFNRPVLLNEDGWLAFVHVHRATESVSLDELTQDLDGNGLTDLTDRALMIRPANSTAWGDADGDGIPDRLDPSPSTPAGAETVEQRGLRRALIYEFQRCTAATEHAVDPAVPCQALYLEPLNGLTPVQFSPAVDTCGVWLDTPWRRETYERLLSGYTDYSRVKIEMVDHGELGGDPASPFAALAVKDVWFRYAGSASVVLLADLDGELFPVASVSGGAA